MLVTEPRDAAALTSTASVCQSNKESGSRNHNRQGTHQSNQIGRLIEVQHVCIMAKHSHLQA
eukprot:1161774-Pelagomonas_calceolata.AAC.10